MAFGLEAPDGEGWHSSAGGKSGAGEDDAGTATSGKGALLHSEILEASSAAIFSEKQSVCLFSKKKALKKMICVECTCCLRRELSLDSLATASSNTKVVTDLFEEEENLEILHLCLACHKFQGLEHFEGTDHPSLTVTKVTDCWYIEVRKHELWSFALQEVQGFASGLIRLHSQGNKHCINCLDSINSSDMFCKFECKVSTMENKDGWASALINEDFSQDCKLDLVLNTCPPTRVCSHCCLRHIDATSNITFLKMKFLSPRLGCKSSGFKKDGFCLNCVCSYSQSFCHHHMTHRTVGITYVNSATSTALLFRSPITLGQRPLRYLVPYRRSLAKAAMMDAE